MPILTSHQPLAPANEPQGLHHEPRDKRPQLAHNFGGVKESEQNARAPIRDAGALPTGLKKAPRSDSPLANSPRGAALLCVPQKGAKCTTSEANSARDSRARSSLNDNGL